MLKINGKSTGIKTIITKNSWQRMKGLMFEDVKKFDYALVFENPSENKINSSVHMIFVFFPIDIIFLDKEKRIVDKVTLQPFTPNYTPKKKAKYFIEMPCGKSKNMRLGDKANW